MTGLPFVLIAEADIVGTTWQWQLSRTLARIPNSVVDAIERLPRLSDSDALALPRGMPLSGRDDVRWEWKENEVIELQLLTGDCVRALLDAPTIDVGFLATDGLDSDTIQAMVLSAADLVSAGMAIMPTATAEILGFGDAAISDRLVAELGADAWMAMQEMLMASIRAEEPSDTPLGGVLAHRRVDPARDPLSRFVNNSLSTVRVITWNQLWDDRRDGVLEVDTNGRPRRIVRERVAV